MRYMVVLLLTVSLASAETFVVAAGVESYDDTNISPLKCAVADAKAFADAFRAAGAPEANVFVLTSDATDRLKLPTKLNILKALQRCREKAEAADTLLFFFAGHGMEKNGQAWLLTFDSLKDELDGTALPMTMVNSILRGFRARNVCFVIDACRNDPDKARADGDAKQGDEFARGMRPKVEAGGAQPPTTALLLACEVGQRAYEIPDENHGAFTYYLLQGLAGKAKAADGAVTLTSLAGYLQREVGAWAQRNNRQQTPRFDNPGGGDFELVKPGVTATATGEVMVRSDPPGAEIVLQGQVVGRTPTTLRLPPGTHRLTLRGEGLEEQTVTAAVRANELAQTELARLRLLPGKVAVETDPPGATVLVNGQETGEQTPCVLTLPPGEARIGVQRTGRAPREESVTVVGGKTLRLPPWVLPEQLFPPPGWPDYLSRWNAQMPQGLQYRVRAKDGMPQVLIPAGEFLMGSPADEEGRAEDEGPQHKVWLGAFWFDLHPVTVQQYQGFVHDLHAVLPAQPAESLPHSPVVLLTWEQASQYAGWVNGRLPSEAQYERVARGRRLGGAYWWGSAYATSIGGEVSELCPSVCGRLPNTLGVFDLTGSVGSWCADFYHTDWYARSPLRDPVDLDPAPFRSLRGSGYRDAPDLRRSARRCGGDPLLPDVTLGLRCVNAVVLDD